MVYMGGRGKNNASRSNQTSHYGIMGGLAPSTNINSGVRRFRLRRARNKQTIPLGAGPGLEFMRENGLLSKNPAGSGGVGLTAVLVERSIGSHGDGDDGLGILVDDDNTQFVCASAESCGDYPNTETGDGCIGLASGKDVGWYKDLYGSATGDNRPVGLWQVNNPEELGENICKTAPCGQKQQSAAEGNPFNESVCTALANTNLATSEYKVAKAEGGGALGYYKDYKYALFKSFVHQSGVGNDKPNTTGEAQQLFRDLIDLTAKNHEPIGDWSPDQVALMKEYIKCKGIDGYLWNVCACKWKPPTARACKDDKSGGGCGGDLVLRKCDAA